ncbi:MAG: hypothetical protein HZA52_13055 [Planctomycetes bacterium]|nr:hypothetical protein [Planctomycetota bacterium]
MADEKTEPKLGAGHASAMFRQGLSELRGVLYAESNVAQPPQYGMYGVPTPSEVSNERVNVGRDEAPRSFLEERMPSPEPAQDVRDDKPHEPERE